MLKKIKQKNLTSYWIWNIIVPVYKEHPFYFLKRIEEKKNKVLPSRIKKYRKKKKLLAKSKIKARNGDQSLWSNNFFIKSLILAQDER